ncbi:MAG: hypothetical protein ACTHOM_16765, partial [Allomuricauda sp.]
MFMLLLSGQTFGQQVDTWFTADRAVNSPPLPTPGEFQLFTPLAPASGTPVNLWYDFVDYDAQDAVPHPAPTDYPLAYPTGLANSFGTPAYLNPAGSIPGIPTLRRNSFNFNPSVEFDGSGNGQALHFRSNSRKEITVFIVFKGRGMGNSAQTQRLLFGGDIDTYHSSTTNLSIGISNGNRFSIGRTWNTWNYFQSGGIDLQEAPTIGTLVRKVDLDPFLKDEVFTTWVNGLPDLNVIRNAVGAERELYLYNRLGKHFNSSNQNRNLTGHIAEVLLADGPLNSNSIQRIESYLAIKYGVTLNNSGGQLGSVVGNLGYDYLAADGTVIWDPTVDPNYRYDIAGLGRDRFEDFESGLPGNVGDLKLRYNLHQRISKSENTEAIVTMSSNTNFGTDNLDQSRTEIDNTTWGSPSLFSYLHNYLLWANDHNGLNQVATELPPQFVSRIEREWKIQKTVSPGGVDPILGVSVRIDLSGSDILDNGNCGELSLIIDTDGDGDFLTGPITTIPVTSIDASKNAYFDGVDFEHLDVFTVAFTDTIAPTASNPNPIIVCDTAPAPDPNVVTDEADNCAVATVAYVGDVTDGLTNPETISRTYRVTDIYGNFTDVLQTIYVFTTPKVDSLAAIEACDSFILPPITGTGLSGNEAYYDASGGPSGGGTLFFPGDLINTSMTLYIYDETGVAPAVCFDERSFKINITTKPFIDVDYFSDPTKCGSDDGSITFIFSDVPDGIYDIMYDGGTFNAVTVSGGSAVVNGLPPGNYQNFRITVNGCISAVDGPDVTLTAPEPPNIDPLANVTACDQYLLPMITGTNLTGNEAYYDLPGGFGGGGNQYLAGVSFNIAGTTTLYIYDENGTCTDEESFVVTINNTPLADAPADVESCDSYILPALANGDYFTGSGGTGTPLFAGDAMSASATIYVFSPGTGSCPDVENSFVVTINNTPVADAPADVESCDTYILPALANGNYFTGSGGTGTPLFTGDNITITTTIYVFSPGQGSCPGMENSFVVTINNTPLADAPADVESCDSYILPALANGNYFDAPNGAGNALFAGDNITTTTTLYVFSPGTGSCPDVENSFQVTINNTPLADAPADVESCDAYILPSLANGDYFTGSGGTGTPLFAGDNITTTTTLYVFSPGTGSCPDVENSFQVTINNTPLADAPADVESCDAYILPALANGDYFDAPNGAGNALFAGDNITTTTTIYVFSPGTGSCPDVENSFQVTINNTPVADAPADIESCDAYILPALVNGDYFDAPNGAGNALFAGDIINSTQIIYVFSPGTGSCPDVENSFVVTINNTPLADAPADVESCDAYILPALVNGNYFDAPNGAGNALFAGDDITITTTIYVFSPGAGSCPDVENSFVVTINNTPMADAPTDVESCDAYMLPPLVNGDYFDAPNGAGNALFAGGNITTTTTIYVFSPGTGSCPDVENSFQVTINNTPLADAPADVESCDAYILPALANGDYFDAPNGAGNALFAGDNITTTTTIYVFSPGTGSCPDVENSFQVTINNTPVADAPADIESCDAYILPALVNGDYFDAPNGAGNALFAGDIINSTQIIYVFSPGTGSCPDVENSFVVTINNTPLADAPADVESCDAYILPALANGDYFDAPNGSGNALFAGDNITTTTTIYVFSPGTGSCPDVENSFLVTINNTPLADAPTDIESCDAYILPALVNGDYFDAPNGAGNALFAGDAITTTTTLYIFSKGTGSCPDVENSFQVTINNTPLADAPTDIESCDSYILPTLVNGDYFDAPNGAGNALFAGDNITTTTTLYVFSPGTGSCPDVENSFQVTINNTPLADAPADIESCDAYILPALVNGDYFDAPNGAGNALFEGDIINSTQIIYVFSPGTGSCPDVENSFVVTINDTPLADAPADVESC